jgi:hypothetical protein
MTADAVTQHQKRDRARAVLTLPMATLIALVAAAAAFVAYVLWPTWPSQPVKLDAPSIPVTVAGVLFDVPPAAIRVPVQRQPGPHERIDLVFLWPMLTPPPSDTKATDAERPALTPETVAAATAQSADGRLFVTIAGLGAVLPPLERLRTIYPRYVEAQASAGPDGLAILPFRAGTPYEGEDLVYLGSSPEQFFARCTRPGRAVPGTCIDERVLDKAEITWRFPRDWLGDWRNVAAGFDRLVAQMHPAAH